jgi:acetyltransferase-like isoleucine patch superfamily enzyme
MSDLLRKEMPPELSTEPYVNWLIKKIFAKSRFLIRWIPFSNLWANSWFRWSGVVSESVSFDIPPIISRTRGSSIKLGNDCILKSKSDSNPLFIQRPCSLVTLQNNAKILIGKKVGMSGTVLISASWIEIGDETQIGANCTIIDNDMHSVRYEERVNEIGAYTSAKPIRIGKGVFIGMQSIILKGVSIGDRSVIGAGSMVAAGCFPSDVLIGGNPAKIIKSLK